MFMRSINIIKNYIVTLRATEVNRMVWGAYTQAGLTEEIDFLGAKLSVEIGCAVHYPAYNKNLFECHCGVIFPLYVVKEENWELLRNKHIEEQRLLKV